MLSTLPFSKACANFCPPCSVAAPGHPAHPTVICPLITTFLSLLNDNWSRKWKVEVLAVGSQLFQELLDFLFQLLLTGSECKEINKKYDPERYIG